jgi:hypothetical protein
VGITAGSTHRSYGGVYSQVRKVIWDVVHGVRQGKIWGEVQR